MHTWPPKPTTQWTRFKRIFHKSEYYSRRFAVLDFLSGGRLLKSVWMTGLYIGKASVGVGYLQHPEFDIRHGKRTQKERVDIVDKRLEDAKRYVHDIYHI